MSHKCRFCRTSNRPDFKSLRSLRSHVAQIHDGGERLGALSCIFAGCQSQYFSRTKFEQHLASHDGDDRDEGDDGVEGEASDEDQETNDDSDVTNRYTCSTCRKVFLSLQQFDSHLDGHEQVVIDSSPQDSSENEDDTALSNIRSELTDIVKNREVTELMMSWVDPSICIHESGERSMAMLMPSSTKRLLEDPIIEVHPIKRRAKGADVNPVELKVALAGHRLGELVDTESYEPVEPSLYLANFSVKAEEIARTFAGGLLQSESSVVLLLKVEVYGRSPSEDIHGIDLAKPTWDLKTVVVAVHDHTRKLLIGTLSYNVLVTAAIDLTTGAVSVGASTSLHVSNKMRLWCRRDKELNMLVERQLRSKFDHAITFAKTAAIFYLFASWECHPVTIFRLLDYYKGKSSSGTKAVAVLFSELAKTQCITRTVLQDLLAELGSGDSSVATTLRAMLEDFKADEQERPLSKDQTMSRLLRTLADGVCGTIRTLNSDKVATAIKARSEALLQDKSSRQH